MQTKIMIYCLAAMSVGFGFGRMSSNVSHPLVVAELNKSMDSPDSAAKLPSSVPSVESTSHNPFTSVDESQAEQISAHTPTDSSAIPVQPEGYAVNPDRPVSVQALLDEIGLHPINADFTSLDLEEQARTESTFLTHLNDNPELITPLISAYEQMESGLEKQFLRSMLAATGAAEVEKTALDNIQLVAEDEQWLALLGDIGVRSVNSRERLLDTMGSMQDPHHLALALKAFSSDTVAVDHRNEIVNRLSYYAQHSNPSIRSAGVSAIGRWAGKQDTYILEAALRDTAAPVREAAVSSVYLSGLQSESIKTGLLELMVDEQQPYHLRLNAHDALKAYSLEGTNHQLHLRFHEQEVKVNTGMPKG